MNLARYFKLTTQASFLPLGFSSYRAQHTSGNATNDVTGLNSFTTGTLTSRDIQNHADYEGSSFGISAGVGFNNAAANNPKSIWAPQGSTAVNPKTGALNTGKASTTVNKSIGWGSDDGHEQSTTASGINTANLTITNESGQTATGKSVEQIKAEVSTDTTTDTVALNSGAIGNNFDAAAVQSELDLQVKVTQEFDKNRQAAKASINKAVDDLKKEKDDPKTTATRKAEIDQSIGQWQRGSVLFDMVAGGLSAPTNGVVGIAAYTLSPAASFAIGQHFKDNAELNKLDNGNRPVEGSLSHILAHTILGAATAAAGGNNIWIGGLSAGGAEAAAPYVAQYLYGKDAKDLTADEKSTVSAIVGLGGAAIGATTGSVGDIASGSALAQNAVENNNLTVNLHKTFNDERSTCLKIPVASSATACVKGIEDKYDEIFASARDKSVMPEVYLKEGKELADYYTANYNNMSEYERAEMRASMNSTIEQYRKYLANSLKAGRALTVAENNWIETYQYLKLTNAYNVSGYSGPSVYMPLLGRGNSAVIVDRPPAGRFSSSAPTGSPSFNNYVDSILDKANTPGKQGLSYAASAWDSHASRSGGTFPVLKGSASAKNEAVANWISGLINNSSTSIARLSGGAVEFRAPNGQGIRLEPSGKINLVDPRRPR